MRLEMELERMKQMHEKELEDKDEELEDVHKSSQRRVSGRLPQINTPSHTSQKDSFSRSHFLAWKFCCCFFCLRLAEAVGDAAGAGI